MGWVRLSYFLIFQCLFLHFPFYNCLLCNSHDKSALLQFKNSFLSNFSSHVVPSEDDFCSLYASNIKSWNNLTDCCGWDGVTCDIRSGYVVGLNFSCSNLRGELLGPNSSIFSLRHLQQLTLAFNDFSGSSIHSTIGDLANLTHLTLFNFGMTGDVPTTISHLSKLEYLLISNIDWLLNDPIKSYSRMRLDDYTWNRLIHNTTNLRDICLYGMDMSFIRESSLSLLTNLSSSLVSLLLLDNKIQGKLPANILKLPNLQEIDLSWNQNLRGELPNSNWTTPLRFLSLSRTAFSGYISDSIGQLKSLSSLELSDCNFDGFIPPSLFNLTQLSLLDLARNNKLQGNFPNSIFQLQNLTILSLSSTNLNGVVDFHQFSKLKTLSSLDLSYNSLLSLKFENNFDCILSNLQYLSLSSSNLSSFPKFLAPLQNLQVLDLSHNRISGSIPKWLHENLLHSWKNISSIDLSFNKLQGDLPIPPNGIGFFSVSNNQLSGDISSALCNASTLSILNLAHNNLTGLIPQCLATFPSLWALDLQDNNLYGNIPDNFSKGNAFKTLKLNGNHLKGPLPRSLAHCTNLEVLDLGNNNIEDTFPYWLEILTTLQVLSLRSNKFHGVITSFGTRFPFPVLKIFDISNNYFIGPLPASYIHNFQGMMNAIDNQNGLKYLGNNYSYIDSIMIVMKGHDIELERILTIFTSIDLSNNMFEGEVPKVIGELHSLKGLNLSHNRITVLNLSENQFEGVIPTGRQFNTFGNDSYVGNPMLCGFPLSKSCNKDKERPPCSTLDKEESGFGWKVIVVGYACGMIFGIILGCNVFFAGKLQWLARLVEVVLNV
ncbi:receptor-like protein 12 [Vigna radiata var. radiata]|uniref:Receptor-like protein 12 n=1 Tax=Vigna radiata var. radiata TaxID=3916 RepID=A0A3Q0F479_VIGRR|nr:receptor-like protein 12 [Vigna radiata var. radiata]